MIPTVEIPGRPGQLDMDTLDGRLNTIAGHLNSQYSLLVDCVIELLTDEPSWAGPGIHTPEQYLTWRMGLSPTRARDLVSDGVLRSYVLDSYSACKLGMQTTGNAGGVRNLRIDPGRMDQVDLLREMGRGLLVTEMMGHGLNLVTGDYSRGASGFWVEDGEIAFPVEEITVAGNLGRMFERLQAVGCDIDRRGSTHTGSWLVEGMTLAGQHSDA